MQININDRKTEFLFESDAEKAILREAARKKKPKLYKKIILNTFIITILLSLPTITFFNYKSNELSKLKANIKAPKNTSEVEKMNSFSDKLKEYNNYYNDKYSILVNKANLIDETVISEYKIVDVTDNLYSDIKLEEETYKNYLELKENIKQRGYYINIRSGFRTFKESNNIYNSYKIEKGNDYAEKYVAKQGASEHNIGLCFDFIISKDKNALSTNYDSDEYFYLENIAYLYGFIIRYPKDKEKITGYNYEPWHLRYVGKDLAKYLKKNNLALEEYYK